MNFLGGLGPYNYNAYFNDTIDDGTDYNSQKENIPPAPKKSPVVFDHSNESRENHISMNYKSAMWEENEKNDLATHLGSMRV